MALSNRPLTPPEDADFQRIGLRRMEFRPPVIRRALGRSAQPLVLMHLRSPSAEAERLLADVMVSGYRVLDPRRRGDSTQRVMLGRIHPQLVDEAVYLAQSKAILSGMAGCADSPEEPGDGEGDLTGDSIGGPSEKVSSEFSPVDQRDWWVGTESPAAVAERMLLGGGTSSLRGPAGSGGVLTSLPERFLDSGDLPHLDQTLKATDLMVQSGPIRLIRAMRRRWVRLPGSAMVSLTMLAASVMLVATWRTTRWLRSTDDRGSMISLFSPAASDPLVEPTVVEPTGRAVATNDSGQKAVDAATSSDGSPRDSAPAEPQLAVTAEQTPPAADRPVKVASETSSGSIAGVASSSDGADPIGKNQAVSSGEAGSQAANAVGSMGAAGSMVSAGPMGAAGVGSEPGAGAFPTPAAELVDRGEPVDGDKKSDAANASGDTMVAEISPTAELATAITGDAGGASGVELDSPNPGVEVAVAEASIESIAVSLPPIPDDSLIASARLRVELAARDWRPDHENVEAEADVAETPGARVIAGAQVIPAATGGGGAFASDARTIGPKTVVSEKISAFRSIAIAGQPGSAERWVATMLCGQAAVLAGVSGDANRAIEDLGRWYAVDRDEATVRLARWVTADASTGDEITAAGLWLDHRTMALVRGGELEAADRLVAVTHEFGVRHRNETIRAESKQWRDVLVIAQRYAAAALRLEPSRDAEVAADDATADGPTSIPITAEDRELAGRYWALVRRDWHRAVPHLAAGATPKLVRLAGIEWLAGQTIDADDAELLADGYLGEAKKAKGWLGDSYALHAHELLVAAATRCEAVGEKETAVELRRRAEVISRDHPKALVTVEAPGGPSSRAVPNGMRKGGHYKRFASRVANADAAKIGGGLPNRPGGAARPTGATATAPVAAGESELAPGESPRLSDKPPEPETPPASEMLGRLFIRGRDVGALVRYQPGMAIGVHQIAQILGRLGRGDAAEATTDANSGNARLEFIGVLTVDRPSTVSLSLATISRGGIQTISIDDTLLPVELAAMTRGTTRYELDLMPGNYVVRWATTLAADDSVSLRVIDESSGQAVRLERPSATTPDNPSDLPTRLQVSLVVGE